MNTRFYIDTEANDDDAYQFAMQYACSLAEKDSDIQRIVLYIPGKQTTGWFNRLFDSNTVKKLFTGLKFSDCPVPFKFETKITYKKSQYGNPSDIVICCGIDSEDIFKIDDYHSVKYIIAIPWLRKFTEKWIKTWNAVEISGKGNPDEKFQDPSCIVKKAMEDLSNSINMSTGILHPMDEDRAKTYIRALHKYEPKLDPDIVGAYLIRELNWDTQYAKDIQKLIETLNKGSYFKGGEKTGLQDYYKAWKKKCS